MESPRLFRRKNFNRFYEGGTMSSKLLVILLIITLCISIAFYLILTKATIHLYIKDRSLIIAPDSLIRWFDKKPLRNIRLFYLVIDLIGTALTLFLILTLYFE